MNKLFVAVAGGALALGATSVFAQCDNTAPILQSNTPVSGTTCGGVAGINLGGAVLGHPSVIYRFTYQNVGAPNPNLITVTGAEREFAVATNCTSAPVGGGAPGVPFDINNSGLVAGTQYFVFVTSDPGLPVTAPPRCGDFSLSPQVLPVELQSFSVD